MAPRHNLVVTVAFHVVCLATVAVPVLVFFAAGRPFKRGFFCDDESLMYPFRESTVTSNMLYLFGTFIPVITMVVLEMVRGYTQVPETIATSSRPFLRWRVPPVLQVLYVMVGVFAFGAASSQLVTDIAKYTIGRLRPHFFDLCQVANLEQLCKNPHTYVEDFQCKASISDHLRKEMRLSFMSGHSSFSAFTMLYTVLYLQARMPWRSTLARAGRAVIQMALLCLAWYTALSRISDYKHHWSDVLAGAFQGYLAAILVVWGLSPLWRQLRRQSSINGDSDAYQSCRTETAVPLPPRGRPRGADVP